MLARSLDFSTACSIGSSMSMGWAVPVGNTIPPEADTDWGTLLSGAVTEGDTVSSRSLVKSTGGSSTPEEGAGHTGTGGSSTPEEGAGHTRDGGSSTPPCGA